LTKPVVISIDAMGGDHGPPVVIPGVVRACGWLEQKNVRLILHGDEAQIAPLFARHAPARALCEIRHTDMVIAMDEKPAQAMRRGKGSSMWNAVEALKTGEAHAAVSAGNTGALMAISKLVLRMAADLERPAIVASWPSLRGLTTVLDVGANVECDAERLVDFAIMGEAFHRAVHGVSQPSVGLLNVGSEDQKGHEEVREAHALLRDGGLALNYKGFVEGNDISAGTVDVIVTDGFTGNVALKTAEGTARFIGSEMRAAFNGNLMSKLGAVIAASALTMLRTRLDPNTVNGAPFLGLNGIVVKSHGGANAAGIASALRVAVDLARSDYAREIQANLQQLTQVLERGRPSGSAEAESR
jgi:glycerol-3-phosphate acyltransferase PlsX